MIQRSEVEGGARPTTLWGEAYGVPVGVRLNDDRLVERITPHLPYGWRSGVPRLEARVYTLLLSEESTENAGRCFAYADDVALSSHSTLPAALKAFESDLQIHVAEMSPQSVFVHAGVVSWKERVILLPGRTFSGKSTLVRRLVQAGALYYSDEYAVLDTTGRVHPHPGPLSIRHERGATRYMIEALGGRAGLEPAPVSLVVMTRFRATARFQPLRLSPGRGALALLANTVPARRHPEAALATLGKVVTSAPVFESERPDACDVADAILDLAESLPDRRTENR